MNESIVVGLVVGGGVAVVGALIGHFLRLREMNQQWDREKQRIEALWTEEERRRKSDRKRELYERELKILSDSVDGLVDVIARVELSIWTKGACQPFLESMGEAYLMMWRGSLVPISLGDEELIDAHKKLIELYQGYLFLIDWRSEDPFDGKEKEFGKAKAEVLVAASEMRRRIRGILEEV